MNKGGLYMEPIKELKAAFRIIMYHNYHAPLAEQPIFRLYPEECLKIEHALEKVSQLDEFISKNKESFPAELFNSLLEIITK